MNKLGVKYSAICFFSGLALWYASPGYFYESKPHDVIAETFREKSLEVIIDDSYRHALPSGLITRPLTYFGLAGLLISAIAPNKKKIIISQQP